MVEKAMHYTSAMEASQRSICDNVVQHLTTVSPNNTMQINQSDHAWRLLQWHVRTGSAFLEVPTKGAPSPLIGENA